MSRIKELKRQLEATRALIDALDADLAAGRLSADEHDRQRAEQERAAGRLFVSLRRAQREDPERPAGPSVVAGRGRSWRRSPLALVPAAVLLVAVGIGVGVGVGHWFTGASAVDAPAGVLNPMPGATPSSGTAGIELQALRRAVAREDAPIPSLLQFAHAALDEGRLAEARRVYERVLAREPRNVEAITHLGGVLFQEARVDEALGKVEEALRLDPRYVHAHWDRTQYLFHGKRDFPAAIKAAEAFLEVVPEGPDADTVRSLIAEARRQATGSAPLPKAR